MDPIVELTPGEADHLLALLTDSRREYQSVKFAFDDGLKVKIGLGTWTPPMGQVVS